MTKTELLAMMSKHEACSLATKYVTNHASDDAQEIWKGCDRADWLCWFLARHNKDALGKFAFACADRAVRVYAPIALDKARLHDEAAKLRALAPIVDRATALAGKDAAYAAASANAYDADAIYAIYAANDAIYAIYAANDANDAAASAADAAAAAYYAANAAAAADEERKLQLTALRQVKL